MSKHATIKTKAIPRTTEASSRLKTSPNFYFAPVCLVCCLDGLAVKSIALSFFRSQRILGWSKLFVPVLKWIGILCKSQTFCARPKDDFHSVNSVFVPAQNLLEQHKMQFNFMV